MEISGFEIGGKRVEFSPAPGNVHPTMAQALVGFAPRDSSIFDSMREPEEEQVAQPMRKFVVTLVRRIDGRVLRHFETMGPDSCTVAAQHVDLAGAGERLHVMTPEAFELQRKVAQEADRAQAAELNRMPRGGYLA
jgi:hypothetical protein